MNVEPRMFVSIHYTLTLNSGEKLDSTVGDEPLGFIQGTGQIIEGLDKAVLGRAVGEKFTVSVPPEEAYGMPSEDMVREIPRENFPEELSLEPGQGFTANGPHGPVSFKVVKADATTVYADFNHALAGETLNFDVEIAEAREARAEELAAMAEGASCSDEDCDSCGGGCGCGS
jgi:FKBP-type peptidyl-prolyl cis-trans isomerase SlyD